MVPDNYPNEYQFWFRPQPATSAVQLEFTDRISLLPDKRLFNRGCTFSFTGDFWHCNHSSHCKRQTVAHSEVDGELNLATFCACLHKSLNTSRIWMWLIEKSYVSHKASFLTFSDLPEMVSVAIRTHCSHYCFVMVWVTIMGNILYKCVRSACILWKLGNRNPFLSPLQFSHRVHQSPLSPH